MVVQNRVLMADYMVEEGSNHFLDIQFIAFAVEMHLSVSTSALQFVMSVSTISSCRGLYERKAF